MRKIRIILSLLMTLLMLAPIPACSRMGGRGAEELTLEIRTGFIAAGRLAMVADITADYGDRVYVFGVRYTAGESGGVIEVLSPEEIAGITAEVTSGDITLVYDGARLDTGALTGNGMSPAEALPALLAQWREGYIKLCAFERLGESDTVAIETDITATAVQKTWFDVKTLLPLRAELSENGVMVIACDFKDIVIED